MYGVCSLSTTTESHRYEIRTEQNRVRGAVSVIYPSFDFVLCAVAPDNERAERSVMLTGNIIASTCSSCGSRLKDRHM